MNCQNCEAPVSANAERCEKCGAKLLHRRVFFGAPRSEEFTLTAEEETSESEPAADPEEWQFPEQRELPMIPPVVPPLDDVVTAPRYGGFFRRLVAAVIDIVMVLVFATVMGVMSYIGYKVGLSAHDRAISFENAPPLFVFMSFGSIILATAYFVVFHGMEGKTIGKGLLGLRVVAGGNQPISYRSALLRWFVLVVTLGLSSLWVLVNRQKRSLHDLVAGTWVIRE